jgi:hypothetical protein
MTNVTQNMSGLTLRIRRACENSGRDPDSVRLLAVSKKNPAAAIRTAFAAGQIDFGENIVQEALVKQKQLRDLQIEWHFIGRIQSNKTRDIAAAFSWAHGVDRLRVAKLLNKYRQPDQPRLNICLQVALADEPGKSGVKPDALVTLAGEIADLPRLRLRGLMCIPPPSADPARQRHWFARLAEMRDQLNGQGFALDTLSMGMSNDLEAAIAEGATLIRIGTAFFGARPG